MDRLVLTNHQWEKMEPHCLGKPADPGITVTITVITDYGDVDYGDVVDGVLYGI